MVRSLGVECQNRIKFSEKMQHTFPTTIPRCTRSILVAVANIRRLVYWIKVFAVLRKVVVRWMAGIRCSQVHVTSLLNQVLGIGISKFLLPFITGLFRCGPSSPSSYPLSQIKLWYKGRQKAFKAKRRTRDMPPRPQPT